MKFAIIALALAATSSFSPGNIVQEERHPVVDLDIYKHIRIVRFCVDGYKELSNHEKERKLNLTKKYLKAQIDFITVENIESKETEILKLLDILQQMTSSIAIESSSE